MNRYKDPHRAFFISKAVVYNKKLPIYRQFEPDDIPVLQKALRFLFIGVLLSFFFQCLWRPIACLSLIGSAGSILLVLGFFLLRDLNVSFRYNLIISVVQSILFVAVLAFGDVFFSEEFYASSLYELFAFLIPLFGIAQLLCMAIGLSFIPECNKKLLVLVPVLYAAYLILDFFAIDVASIIVSAVTVLILALLYIKVKMKITE